MITEILTIEQFKESEHFDGYPSDAYADVSHIMILPNGEQAEKRISTGHWHKLVGGIEHIADGVGWRPAD